MDLSFYRRQLAYRSFQQCTKNKIKYLMFEVLFYYAPHASLRVYTQIPTYLYCFFVYMYVHVS